MIDMDYSQNLFKSEKSNRDFGGSAVTHLIRPSAQTFSSSTQSLCGAASQIS